MPFLLDDDQRQIVTGVERVLGDSWAPDRLRDLLERTGEHDAGFWTTCRDMGWTGIAIDGAHGGLGMGPIALCLTTEVAGRFVAGAPFLTTAYGVAEALRLYAPIEVAADWLPGLADGSVIGASWLTPALGAETSLGLRDGAVSGVIGPVTAGSQAGVLVALAKDADGQDRLVLIDLAQGVDRAAVSTFDNSRGYADLTFTAATATILEGGREAGLDLLARIAVVTAFEQIGIAEACLERARTFANERQAFGQPIGKFQAIKHRIAEMYVANALARGNAMRAVLSLRDEGADRVLHAGAARLSAIEASEFAAREAIQTHGAIGVTWEHDLHLFYRRARALTLEMGSSGDWQDVVAQGVIDARRNAA